MAAPTHGPLKGVRVFDLTIWMVRRPAPLLGEHTEQLLKKVGGYSQVDVLRLLRAGVAVGAA